MCFFDQIRWKCGYWRWDSFRQQCNKEYHIGETCGLKLVYSTQYRDYNCKVCDGISKKEHRIERMEADIERWRREGNRPATLEKTENDVTEVQRELSVLLEQHSNRLRGIMGVGGG